MKTTRFLLTLKNPIKVKQSRLDKSPIIIKTATLVVDWPLDETTLPQPTPVEAAQLTLTVVAFTDGDNSVFWESPLRESGSEPFELQLKRDNILSRQAMAQ